MAQNKWQLTWFEKYGDRLVGEVALQDIALADLQALFKLESDDLMLECYPVRPIHKRYLQQLVSHELDLDLYDYFVEGFSA